jgi:hypothetical protein
VTESIEGSARANLRLRGRDGSRLHRYRAVWGVHGKQKLFIGLRPSVASITDFLIVAAPGGEATRHLVDAQVLEKLGTHGYLVNVGRGSVFDSAAAWPRTWRRRDCRRCARRVRRRTGAARRTSRLAQSGVVAAACWFVAEFRGCFRCVHHRQHAGEILARDVLTPVQGVGIALALAEARPWQDRGA